MDRCELCQALMLEYVYDLVEGGERGSLETHLADCAKCQAALAKVRQQQRLLAAAAKTEFSGVRFQVPATANPAPATIPMPQRKARPSYGRWAMAAAVLLAVLGLGGGGAWVRYDYLAATQSIDEHKVALADGQKEVRDVDQTIQQFPQQQQAKFDALEKQLNEQQLRVIVSGPQTMQAGAPNEYRIFTQDLNGVAARARLNARVLDRANKVVFEQKDIDVKNGEHRLVLPPSVAVRPNDNVRLEVLAKREDGRVGELKQQLDLVAPLYVTHLATDKPMYQPGETVHYRSLTLERFSLKPAQEPLQLAYTLLDPSGAQAQLGMGSPLVNRADTKTGTVAAVVGPDKKPVRGIGAGDYYIDPTLNGGEYTLRVSEMFNRFPAQERKFIVNKYQPHRLNKKLDFSKKSYGTGEEVSAACEATRAEGGGHVANRPVEVSVKIDGQTYGVDGKPINGPISYRTKTDAQGKVVARFKLPAAIQTGDATVSVLFDDGGNREPIVKPIPIVLKKLDVQFFPEGGDLVAGLENRVYFQVRNTRGKAADLKGHIVDADKKTVVEEIHTLTDAEQPGVNQGLGVFAFKPTAGGKYELKIDAPPGMEGIYKLPDVKDDGVVLTIGQGVTTSKEPISAVIRSAKADRKLLVGAYCRGRLLDHQRITVKKGEEAKIELKPAAGVGGVYRVTAFEERGAEGNRANLVPVAERLVYRQPAEQLLINVKPDKKLYVPGDKATLVISTLDEAEKSAPAILMVAIVDKSVVTMADEKTHRAMPTHFLMTSEVKKPEDLEYADFLIGSHPKANAALDLLLGTQGWRRFAEQDPIKFKQHQADDAERMLVSIGLSPRPKDLEQEQWEKLTKDTNAEMEQLQEKRVEALQRLEREHINQAYLAAFAKVTHYDEWRQQIRLVGIPMLCLVLLVAAIAALVVGMMRGLSRGVPYYLASVACTVVVGVLFMTYWENRGRQEQSMARVKDQTMTTAEMDFGAPMDEARAKNAPMPMAAAAEEGAPKMDAAKWNAQNGPRAGDIAPVEPLEGMDKLGAERGADKNKEFFFDKDGKKLDADRLNLNLEKAAKPAEAKGELGKGNGDGKGDDKERFLRAGGGAMPAGAIQGNKMNGVNGGMPGGLGLQQAGQAGFARQAGFGGGGKGAGAPMGGPMPAPQAEMGRVMGGRAMRVPMQDMPLGKDARMMGGEELGLRRKRLEEQAQMIQLPPFLVREYAHFRTHGTEADRRSDATETVYWNPVLVLADGKGEASFDLSDQVTSFQVTAYGHTLDGRLGAVTSFVESRLPLTLEPKTPIEVTANDKIDIPLAIANNTPTARDVEINAAFSGLTLLSGKAKDKLNLPADQRTRRIYRLQPTILEGEASVTFQGFDSVQRSFKVVPDGFPVLVAKSDLLEKSATNEVVLPETWIKGTLKMKLSVYPSTLADLQKGLDAMLQEPNGCFEQTSTSNYPNLLILDYLKESDQTKPEVEKRARDLLARGYQKLTSFECPKTGEKDRTGFEWFGSPDQAHEALTAYGLLQFRDMSRVQEVDPAMLQRTRNFLMAQRDGKGGFKRNARALDTFGRAPDNITNAYIVWAVTESGKDDDVAAELTALTGQAKDSKDPYFLALVANSLINRGKTGEATELLKKLVTAQQADGHLDAAQTSITGSGGRDLQIETTGLAVLAWLKGNPGEFNAPVQKAVKWIGQQRGGQGGFGSTQSTILALKSLIAFTKANKKTPEAGTLALFVGDKQVGKLDFAAEAREALEIKLADAENILKPGKNTVRAEITGQNAFPYTLSWSYQTMKPASADNCPVHLTAKLDRATANEGETVTLNVTVENPSDAERSMVVAIVGLPAGLTIPEDMKQLKEHAQLRDDGKQPGRISYFETRGRELILYWRGMGPKQKLEVPVELICRVPGEYRGPASRAYMYYNADYKHWVEPLAVTITPKAE